MPSFSRNRGNYIPVDTSDESLSLESNAVLVERSAHFKGSIKSASLVAFAFILVVILLAVGIFEYRYLHDWKIYAAVSRCQNPTLRQEWRSLSTEQQNDYIQAALCLQSTPSRLHSNMSLYEDFPFLHDIIGDYAHETAAFLTWHRYFIYLYESSLRDECGHKGALPYWDWSLDWKDLSESPIFWENPGFGGNSKPQSPASKEAIVGGDRCVNDGPWAGMIVHWWSQKAPPHCLSRGFQDVTPISDMGHYLSAEVLEELHNQPDYESFFMMMEHGVHNAVQVAIGGDIMYNTAPYDPIFYLHHSQLDRLWWRWQQTHSSHQMQYLGLASNESDAAASLDDIISMGDFAPGVAVKDVMSTEAGILCYRY